MSDDVTQPQDQGGQQWQRARELSLQRRQPPARVPGYELERCLGQGAYGEVWLAIDQNNPGRRVAVKFYTRRGGDWALLAREVEKLNFLATDRFVVQLLTVGWDAEPPYYVMEFMEKGSLAERLQAGPLAVPEAVALFREVTVGVVHAHNRGVLHCDLKPANVLLGPDDQPRLADFGQSRLSNEQTPALGTLFYMAPEQADLHAAPDARWDVYALGALLHCLLVGQPPYRDAEGSGTLSDAGPLDERLSRYRRLLQDAPRPRRHRQVAGIDRNLIEVIDRCLAIQPSKRFPNAQAVLNALDVRALRRARRPLLVLGAIGPMLLLLLMGWLVRSELDTAVDKTTATLTDAARVSNSFAAAAVAEKVAGKIDRRWRVLEQEAAEVGFRKLLRAAQGSTLGTPEQSALQKYLDVRFQAHTDVAANAWALFDNAGTLLARSPHNPRTDKFIGQRYAYANFFTGLESDLPKAATAPALTRVHRSNVFLSDQSGTRKVAFSAPVWDGKSHQAERLGVLMMTVEVGNFAELRTHHDGERVYMAVLVDRRPDANGKRGAILEHPQLAELRRQKVREDQLQFFADPSWLEGGAWDANYADPIGAAHPEYRDRWLAARHPVLIEERPEARDTGWLVVVQERYDTAIGPVLRLRREMVNQGRWAVAVAVTVVTALWLFVIGVLNESTGSRLFAWLRRRAGLATESMVSAKSSSSSQPSAPRPVLPGARTVTERPDG